MNKTEKNLEMLALKESLTAGSISTQEYIAGITKIIKSPEDEKFSATKNLGLRVFEDKQIIQVGKISMPFTDQDKSRQLRVATHLKDNPEVANVQSKFYKKD